MKIGKISILSGKAAAAAAAAAAAMKITTPRCCD